MLVQMTQLAGLRRRRPSGGAGGAGVSIRGSAKDFVNNGPTLTIAVPSGTVNGDKMVMIIASNGSKTLTPSPPTGWTALDTESFGGGNSALFAFGRTAASEPASYVVTASAFDRWSGAIVSIANCSAIVAGSKTTTPITTASSLATASFTAINGSLIISAVAYDADTMSVPASTTLLQQATAAQAGITGILVVWEGPVGAGATTARTFSVSSPASMATLALECKV